MSAEEAKSSEKVDAEVDDEVEAEKDKKEGGEKEKEGGNDEKKSKKKLTLRFGKGKNNKKAEIERLKKLGECFKIGTFVRYRSSDD